MGFLDGKRALIVGVASPRSIAWGIAKAMADAGAELAFSYQGEAFGKRLEPLAQSVGSDIMVDVDVTEEASMDAAFATLKERWGTLDFVVHAIAFSDKNELTGRFINTSRDNFKNSLAILLGQPPHDMRTILGPVQPVPAAMMPRPITSAR